MNIKIGGDGDRDVTIIQITMTNNEIARRMRRRITAYGSEPDVMLHELGDVAFKLKKGMIK